MSTPARIFKSFRFTVFKMSDNDSNDEKTADGPRLIIIETNYGTPVPCPTCSSEALTAISERSAANLWTSAVGIQPSPEKPPTSAIVP
jgi:hypothetical protein